MAETDDYDDDDSSEVTEATEFSTTTVEEFSPAEEPVVSMATKPKRVFDVTIRTKDRTIEETGVEAVDESEAIRLMILKHSLKSHQCQYSVVSDSPYASAVVDDSDDDDEE